MDPKQLQTLRRKRHVIAQNVIFDETTTQELLRRRLLTKNMINEMKLEKTNFSKMLKYIELLGSRSNGLGSAAVFDRFCKYLDAHYPNVHDEVVAELKAIQGELKVDDYVSSEARILIFREFESIVRLSEEEKNDMAELLALRMQVSKEMWKRRIDSSEDMLKKLLDCTAEREALLRDLLRSLSEFVFVNKSRLNDGGNGIGPEEPLIVDAIPYEELSDKLIDCSSDLIHISSQCLEDRQTGLDEKVPILKELDLENTPNVVLDKETQQKLEDTNRELDRWEGMFAEKRKETTDMQANIEQMKEDQKRRQEQMEELMKTAQERLELSEDRMKELLNREKELKRDLEEAKVMAKKYRSKYAVMSNTRRLGYVDSGILTEVKRKEGTSLPKVDKSPNMTTKR